MHLTILIGRALNFARFSRSVFIFVEDLLIKDLALRMRNLGFSLFWNDTAHRNALLILITITIVFLCFRLLFLINTRK